VADRAVRRIQRIVSTEVTDCPRLFTLEQTQSAWIKRVRAYEHHYRLTLWCEHEGYEHPWNPATYEQNPPKEWFAQIAPYAALVFRTLQLIVPLAGAVAVASLPQVQQDQAKAHLQIMSALVADLPDDVKRRPADGGLGDATGQLSTAEGHALRALRATLLEHDPLRGFGGMRRVLTPSGDLLWVCPDHHSYYDPGLPAIP